MKLLLIGAVVGGLFTLVFVEVAVCIVRDYRMGRRWNKDIDKSLRKCRRKQR